jgi:hypothetical protein
MNRKLPRDGHIVRRNLQLKTHKSHGVFVLADTEKPKLQMLYGKYGLSEEVAGR